MSTKKWLLGLLILAAVTVIALYAIYRMGQDGQSRGTLVEVMQHAGEKVGKTTDRFMKEAKNCAEKTIGSVGKAMGCHE